MYKPNYIVNLNQVPQLSDSDLEELKPVIEKFTFRTNDYYQKLINWEDPDDPIRKIVIPSISELQAWGRLDASDEEEYTKVPGLEHKYEYTALLLVNDVCGAYCRFCFRKRLFMDENDEAVRDVSAGIKYIKEHPEINNVLLTGGDPLVLSTSRLENIICQLKDIDHVKIIRIGTKIPVFNPYRIINDPSLVNMFEKFSSRTKRIYIMTHFNHPREITETSGLSLDLIRKSGAVAVNQTPLIRGINDDPDVLSNLFNKLSYMGVAPYYLFICRPTVGNKTYAVPIEKSFEIFEKARMKCSGLAKRARLVMSHSTGKIEIVGLTETHIYMRYHRAADPQEKARFMILERNSKAYWFDDYQEIIDEYSVENPYRCFGPE